jgi:hypothetical protein
MLKERDLEAASEVTMPRDAGSGVCHPVLNVDASNTKKLTAKSKLLANLFLQ